LTLRDNGHRTYLGAAEKGRLSVEDVDVPAPDEGVNGSAQNLIASERVERGLRRQGRARR